VNAARRIRPVTMLLACAALAALAALAGCAPTALPPGPVGPLVATAGPSPSATGVPAPLPSVEVTSYRGKRVDPISVLHENSIKGPQNIDPATYRLHIDGLVKHPLTLTYDQVASGPQSYTKIVTLNCVEGWSATLLWQGVLVRDVLRAAEPQPGAKIVIFKARDGYTDAFPIEYFTQKDILMAYRGNGLPLTAEWGWPFQLVAEDKWGYKWVKWIDEIQLSSDTTYRGYWEQRGYSNDGSLSKAFIGP
jgi:DMSO/TMAO reductase YedYZ molybdopterin-dependent catalytic subunit